MNRRGFIGALLAGAVLDPERLLWEPGKKLISIPAVRAESIWEYMDRITYETMQRFHADLERQIFIDVAVDRAVVRLRTLRADRPGPAFFPAIGDGSQTGNHLIGAGVDHLTGATGADERQDGIQRS